MSQGRIRRIFTRGFQGRGGAVAEHSKLSVDKTAAGRLGFAAEIVPVEAKYVVIV
jgi:hypothetical protein